jgi:hypothetical protein
MEGTAGRRRTLAVVMAKPKPKIPRINFAKIKFELDDQQWQEVEGAFGRTLDTQTRQEIATATGQFLQFAQAEKNMGSTQLVGQSGFGSMRSLYLT